MNMEDIEVMIVNFDAHVLFPLKVKWNRLRREGKLKVLLGILLLLFVLVCLFRFYKIEL